MFAAAGPAALFMEVASTMDQKENKMGVMPVNRLLITMSLPMIISMLVQALYNVVDSVFVSRIPEIGEAALTAVSLAFPYQNLMIGLAVGTGVGVNALLSRSLGEKNYDMANRTAECGVFLSVISFLIFALAGLLLVRPFYALQVTNQVILAQGVPYLTICSVASFGIFVEIMFERLLQSTGKTFYTMLTQGAGAIVNIVMDPILIFGLGPFPAMQATGAALATVLGQIVAAILAVFFHLRFNHEVKLDFRSFRPSGKIIGRIYAVGVPSIIMNSIGSVMVFGMNKILLAFTETAAAVFGIYFKVQSFVFMPVFGLNNGMVPIIAYNYGAAQRKRLVDTVKLGAVYATCIMLVGLFILQVFPVQILGLFKASEEMLAIGVPALRIISLCFLLAGFDIVCSSTFQALGHGVLSMMVSLIRQLLVLLPSAYLFSLSGVLDLVWLSFPLAELFSLLFCCIFMRRIYKKIIKPLGE